MKKKKTHASKEKRDLDKVVKLLTEHYAGSLLFNKNGSWFASANPCVIKEDEQNYFVVCSVQDPNAGRDCHNFKRLECLAADLDGQASKGWEKAVPKKLHDCVTMVIQSSPENLQAIFVIDQGPEDYEEARLAAKAFADSFGDGTDDRGNYANRFMRLPFGINGKSPDKTPDPEFKVRLVHLNEEAISPYKHVMKLAGVDANSLEAEVKRVTKSSKGLTDLDSFNASEEQVREIVRLWQKHLKFDIDDHDDWVLLGFCVRNWSRGSQQGWELLDKLSKDSPKYDHEGNLHKWETMDAGNKHGFTFRSVVKQLKDKGVDVSFLTNTQLREQSKGFDPNVRPSQSYGDIVRDCVFIEEQNAFYNTFEGKTQTTESVNMTYYGLYTKETKEGPRPLQAAKYFAQHPQKRLGASLGWCPIDDMFFTYQNKRLINTYAGFQVAPKQGDVSQWIDLTHHLYGEKHAEMVIDHIAFSLQHPTEKIRWQVLTIGRQRVGKSSVLAPLKRILGSACGVMTTDDVDTGWGDFYAQKKVLIVEEVYRPSDKKFFNDIKAKLANSDVEMLNIKGQGLVVQQNLQSYYLFSNHENAVKLDYYEDKLLVLKTTNEAWGDDDKFDAYHKWVANEGSSFVLDYLLSRDVSKFRYGSLPERTSALMKMCDLTKPDYQNAIREMHECAEGEFANLFVRFDALRAQLAAKGYSKFGNNGLSETLQEIGYLDEYAFVAEKRLDKKRRKLPRIRVHKDVITKRFTNGQMFDVVLYLIVHDKLRECDKVNSALVERASKWFATLTDKKALEIYEKAKSALIF